MSPGDVDAGASDGDISAPGEWSTAGAEHLMYSSWPEVLPCSLCSWVPFVFVTLYKDSVSSGDGDVDSSDGEVSAPGDWPTAGAGHIMLSMWPGVRSSSLCSWTLSSSTIFESVRLMTRPRPRCFHSRL